MSEEIKKMLEAIPAGSEAIFFTAERFHGIVRVVTFHITPKQVVKYIVNSVPPEINKFVCEYAETNKIEYLEMWVLMDTTTHEILDSLVIREEKEEDAPPPKPKKRKT